MREDARMTEEARDAILAATVAQHPDAFVVAISPLGLFTDLPDDLRALGLRPIEQPGTALNLAIEADHQAVVDAWLQVQTEGVSTCLFHPVAAPGALARLHFVDTTYRNGLFTAMVTGLSLDGRLTIEAEPIRPRLISMRKDQTALILGADPGSALVLGWTPEELAGRRSLELVHPDDHRRAIASWVDMLAAPAGSARRVRLRHLHKDGRAIWFEVTNHNFLADPDDPHVLAEMLDISDEMAAQEALRASELLLRRLTEALPLGVLQIDRERRITYQNERFARAGGTVLGDVLNLERLADVVPGDRDRVDATVDAVLSGGDDADLEYGWRDPVLGLRRVRAALRALENESGEVTGAIVSLADVTEDVRLREELHLQATYDALTGCLNRASTIAALQQCHAAGRSRGTAVVFLDLDGFKPVNDRYGHAAGDRLLEFVAGRLRAAVRDGDAVGRFGGDEFVVVCRDVADVATARRIGEALVAALDADGPEVDGTRLRARASVGVAWSPPGGCTADALIARADAAMYAAKKGRSALAVAD